MPVCVLLLLLGASERVMPLIAIPGVIVGFILSVWLMVSGVIGMVSTPPKSIAGTRHTRARIRLPNLPYWNALRR